MANILVTDDDLDVRQILRVMLKRGGHEVTLAPGGLSGLELVTQKNFDLMICDVMMPDMDGYQVTRRVRANASTKEQLILILTARAQPADYQAAMAAGADAYLSKPVTHDVLNAKVAELLKAKQLRDQDNAPEEVPAPVASAAVTAPQPVVQAAPVAQPAPVAVAPAPAPVAAAPVAAAPAQVQTPAPAVNGAKKTARLVSVLGLRGGVGTTTVAVNMASALTRMRKRTCLVDLSPSVGHVAMQLRQNPDPNWEDLGANPDQRQVGKLMAKHASGLYTLSAPPKAQQRGLQSGAFAKVNDVLGSYFSDIVLDCSPWLDEATIASLRQSAYIVMVLAPDMGSIVTLRGTLTALKELGLDQSRFRFVLNNISPDPMMTRSAVEQRLNMQMHAEVPYDAAQNNALLNGQPLVLSNPQSPLSNAVGRFTAGL